MAIDRRRFFNTCTMSALWTLAPRQFKVLAATETDYRNYHRCLPDYITRLAETAYNLRNERLAGLTSASKILDYKEWSRNTFWQLIGGKMEKTPLNSRVTRSFEREDYRVENIVFESQPGFHVPGNLYIPKKGNPPYPGVLFQMGHSLNGKAAFDYQRCCLGLVKLGFVVFGFDPMGQGERAYYPRENGYMTRLNSADSEHTVPGRQMILIGDTSTRLQAWDAVRALDFLATHPLVDASKLASTGNSGGATLTMLLAAIDDRLQVAALSCGNTENHACKNFIAPGSTDDAEQNILNGGPHGFDRWDLLYPFAPKPLLFLNSSRDFFGTYSPNYISSGREEYEKLRKVYEISGYSDRIQWIESPLPHNLAYSFRMEIYRWMLRWLKELDENLVQEPPVEPEEDRVLFAGTSGNIVRDFGGETPFSLNRSRVSRISTPDSIDTADLVDLLQIRRPSGNPNFRQLGSRPSVGLEIEAVEVESDDSVWIPAWLFVPEKEAGKTLVLIEPSGRSGQWKEDGLYQRLGRNGIAVCAPDIRWLGDLRPEFSKGARNHAAWHQDEETWAWASLMLGKPLLGQKVTDLLALVSAVRQHPVLGKNQLVLAARGHVTVPALIAAALSPEVDSVLLTAGLVSFQSIVEHEDYQHPFGNFVFGILQKTDLPQIATLLGDRKLTLAGPVDGRNEPVPRRQALQTYRKTTKLNVTEEPKWTLEFLESQV